MVIGHHSSRWILLAASFCVACLLSALIALLIADCSRMFRSFLFSFSSFCKKGRILLEWLFFCRAAFTCPPPLSVSSGIFLVFVDTDRHLTPQTGGGALKEEARVPFVVQKKTVTNSTFFFFF